MGRVRPGTKGALVVVDVQVDVMDGIWDRERISTNVVRAVELARSAGIPVVWVQHADHELVTNEPGWQWIPELVVAEDELLVHKSFNSSFEDTVLSDELEATEVSHIVLCGASTNWCIRATAYGALSRGYDLTIVSDAHSCRDAVFADGSRVEAAGLINELNGTVGNLTYPGVSTRSVAVDQIEFDALV